MLGRCAGPLGLTSTSLNPGLTAGASSCRAFGAGAYAFARRPEGPLVARPGRQAGIRVAAETSAEGAAHAGLVYAE